ncbi:MAG TPA: tetratricopeptide repeat protein [Cytophaga sp.]|jgi:two-component system NarL family sensor kinase|nr:tetratricopeptide repeat protein [Cytophaga sp.]
MFLKPQFFPVFISILVGNYSYTQNIPDSLLHKLSVAPNDSVKARTLLDIGETIEATSTEKSFAYYQQALTLSQRIKNNHLLLSSLNDIGICYIELNKMDSAVVAFEEAIAVARQLNDALRVAKITTNIGNVYLHKNDRVRAIDYYLQSARLWETAANQDGLPALYANINSLLNDQKEYDKALEYGNKAIALAAKIGDDFSGVNALLNLSNTYSGLGKFEKQHELLQQALPLAKKGENIEQIATVYNNLGDYFYEKKQYQPSLNNYLESYKYSQQLGNQYHLCTESAMLALLYYKLNENDKALQYILQAEKLAVEVGARADLKEIYQTRAEIEQQKGNYKLASEYFSKTIVLRDSLFKAETSEKVAEVEAKYEDEKKQKEITQLQKDKEIQSLSLKNKSTLNYFLIASVATLIIIGFLVYRNLRHRHQLAKQQDELNQQRIRELEKDRQLVAVDSLLKGQEEERSRLAKDLHDGLGGLLSGVKYSLSNMKDNLIITPDNMAVFERSLDMIDTSIKELRRVAHNMMPEMLVRFGLDEALKEYCNSLNATKLVAVKYQSFGMNTRIDSSKEIIIYRIVQELLNNILKHAAAAETLVQLVKEESRLSIVVEDDGKGFEVSALENDKGAGWTSIRSRVDYLQGHLDINSEAGKGTSVTIEINV